MNTNLQFKSMLLLLTLLVPRLLLAQITTTTIVYVNASATGSNSGTTWLNAYTNLESALAQAHANLSNNYEIRVATGTYKPSNQQGSTYSRNATFVIKRGGVKVIGGYNAATGARNIAGNLTTLSGNIGSASASDNSVHVMVIAGIPAVADSVVLDGFTISDGRASNVIYSITIDTVEIVGGFGAGLASQNNNIGAKMSIRNCSFMDNIALFGGGGISNINSSPTIRNCSFIDNSAEGSGPNLNRGGGIFNYQSNAIISDCIFSGNWADEGAGINNAFSSTTISNCIFTSNTASEEGAGITNETSSSLIINCVFTNNTAIEGAGIYNYDNSTPTITNCTFTGNVASTGGGISNKESSPVLSRCQFIGNTSTIYSGGGMYNYLSAPKLSNCNFSGNTASTGSGGGMLNSYSNVELLNCSFIGNTANSSGGGVDNGRSYLELSNCLFSGNAAMNQSNHFAGGGGGIYVSDLSEIEMSNCSFSGNTVASSAGSGGGVYIDPSSIGSIVNSIFYNNTTENTGDAFREEIFKHQYTSGISSLLTVSNCLIRDYSPTAGNVYTSGSGIIKGNPLFVNPADPDGADNIVGTADDGLALQSCSPARDMGNNMAIPTGVTNDIVGNNRIRNATVDLGAYEAAAFNITSVVYVNGAISASGNGQTWATAFKTLDEALDRLKGCANIDSIKVAAGTYIPGNRQGGGARDATFAIGRGGIKLIGGYNATTGVRNIANNPTILSGEIGTIVIDDNAFHVMVIAGLASNADSVVIDGFTITRGNADGTGTLEINDQNINRSNGGGLYTQSNNGNTKIAIRNCIINSNIANFFGGGMHNVANASPTLTNCIFINNSADAGGGGVSNNASSPVLNNCIFNNNSATLGAGMFSLSNSSPTVSQNTFVSNAGTGSTSQGAGVYYSANSGGMIVNSIFHNNITANTGDANREEIYKAGTGTVLTVSFSVVRDYSSVATNNFIPGNNIIVSNPLFVNITDPNGADNVWATADDGLRLQKCSPAINMGNNFVVPSSTANDLLGFPRIQHSVVDFGAYEANSITSSTSAIKLSNANSTAWQLPNAATHYSDDCTSIIATVTGDGMATSIQGNTTAKVWIEATAPADWVKRHYEITPNSNASNATGRITLYFTQADFDDFNANNTTKLPMNAADAANNKANLKIEKRQGTSSNNTGLPGSYSGNIETIDPVDADIIWNAVANRWEVSFSTIGFSGFFAKTQGAALPLQLLSFKGNRNEGINNFEWKTASESNILNYELQRSSDAQAFASIATIRALNGLSQVYNYNDTIAFTGKLYYRLKIVDNDGKSTYSEVITFSDKAASAVALVPNPARDVITIYATDNNLLQTEIIIIDSKGSIVMKSTLTSPNHKVNISNLSQGIYFVKFVNGAVLKLVKE